MAPTDEDRRRAVRQSAEQHAEHERQLGRMPDSRRIEQRWAEVARRNERRDNDQGRKP